MLLESTSAGNSAISVLEISLGSKLNNFYDEEEGDMIVMEVCADILSSAMKIIQRKYLRTYAYQFLVNCALEAIKKSVQMNCYFHNVCYTAMEKGSWQCDEPVEPCSADSWAAYRAPLVDHKPFPEKKEENIPESKIDEDKPSKENLKMLYDLSLGKMSPSTSSQDAVSLTDYLEVLSTSSEEEMHPTSMVRSFSDRASRLSGMSSKMSDKLSQITGRSATSIEELTRNYSEMEGNLSLVFYRTISGEAEKGLCVPTVFNRPTSNVVKEFPEVESYDILKVEKRKIKVTRKTTLPRRRSDTKLKMMHVVEDPKEKKRGLI